jgi:hypothetical protein
MRIGIPVTSGRLSPHFGHCEEFALIDIDETKREILSKELIPSPPHQPGMLPGWLADDPEKVALDYVRGALVTGDNACDHSHDHACDHH